MAKKVSIVVSVYNVEKYLNECLDSILNQTYTNLEIITVDDGSTDNSSSILDEYSKKDSRIKVIHQENKGVSSARNLGFDVATGDYIIFLDADDVFKPDMIEKMLNSSLKHNTDITVCSEWGFIDDINKPFDLNIDLVRGGVISSGAPFSTQDNLKFIFNFTVLWAWDKLYKKEFLDLISVRFNEDRNIEASEDMLFVAQTLIKAKTIVCLDDCLIYHRSFRAQSLEATRKDNAPFLSLTYLEEKLKSDFIFEDAEQSFINLALSLLYWHAETRLKTKGYEIYSLMHDNWLKYFDFKSYGADYYYNKEKFKNCMKLFGDSYPLFCFKQFARTIFDFDINSNSVKIVIFGIKIKFKTKLGVK